MSRSTAGCGCSANRASGDPNGMSISGLAGLRGARKSKAKKGASKSKRKAPKRTGGAFCVLTAKGKTFGCHFKTRASAEKMAKHVKGRVKANKGK